MCRTRRWRRTDRYQELLRPLLKQQLRLSWHLSAFSLNVEALITIKGERCTWQSYKRDTDIRMKIFCTGDLRLRMLLLPLLFSGGGRSGRKQAGPQNQEYQK